MHAYLQFKAERPDGTADSFLTARVEAKESPLWHHTAGLQYTASGYGRKIPTPYMVKWAGRWRRVYCAQFANAGSLYIGKPGAWLATVEDIEGREESSK